VEVCEVQALGGLAAAHREQYRPRARRVGGGTTDDLIIIGLREPALVHRDDRGGSDGRAASALAAG
jgi:hypothetical protein